MRLFPFLILISALSVVADEECPSRCWCLRTTVRCMFVHMAKVPDAPFHTTILDLRFNEITELQGYSLRNLKDLNTILLNNNRIARIENHAFHELKELRYLYLYKNRIRQIEPHAFQGLQSLEQLYMQFNKLEYIEPGTFANLPSLERLFLHHNRLTTIPTDAISNLRLLRRLRLDANPLVCDCGLLWLIQMLKEKQTLTQSTGKCDTPASLRGRLLGSLNSEDFSCKKPLLLEEPHDVEAASGSTVYMHCKAEGQPDPNIIWLHNSNEITPYDERFSVLEDGTLMIKQAQDTDEGVYECMAKNAAGEVKSRRAAMKYMDSNSVKVSKVKPYLVRKPPDEITAVGKTIKLPCEAKGVPTPEVTWTRDGAPILLHPRRRVSSDGTLTIIRVEPSDAGEYTCQAVSFLGIDSATATVIVQGPPTFTETPRDQSVPESSKAELICQATGVPEPVITWLKDGQRLNVDSNRYKLITVGKVLKVYDVKLDDEGTYTCHAENILGTVEAHATLKVKTRAPPEFETYPEDTEATPGSTVRLTCIAEGYPRPVISWRKANRPVHLGRNHQMLSDGTLIIRNVHRKDSGVYECVAENEAGQVVTSVSVTVREYVHGRRFPGDRYLAKALEEAQDSVDKAINNTLIQLFNNSNPRNHHEILRMFRFPEPEAQKDARAAEVFERTLQLVKKYVESGAQFNLTGFSYSELLSPHNLELLANMSGCLKHSAPNCSNICFHRKYRSYDGSCNNLKHPSRGASLTPFARLLPPNYENGFNTPVGWSKTKLYNGFPKPSARAVSVEIVSTSSVQGDAEHSHMLMQWGQFLDHDLDFSMPSISHESFIDGEECSNRCDFSPPCFPIEVPVGDHRIKGYRCMEFVRSSSLCGSGMTSVFFNRVMPREQVNQLTSFIDGSNVYGSTEKLALHLRNLSSNAGLLRVGPTLEGGKPFLPVNDGQPNDCKKDTELRNVDCFLAGDVRSNEQLGLLSMHTLWFREHNRVAEELHRLNPHWSGDRIYHESRKIVGAQMQHITYAHWLPKILGPQGMNILGTYKSYNSSVNPSIVNVFATAALRFGHFLINPILLRLNETYQPVKEGHLPLRRAFFAPHLVLQEGGIDPLIRGLLVAPTKLRQADQLLNSELTDHLFEPALTVAQDLASLNIQRGRDHGLPSYSEWRRFCQLPELDLNRDIPNSLREKLLQLYGHPDNIDIWVGGIIEEPVPGAKVGPTFLCLLGDQFKRLRDGDRFWYENSGVFEAEQLAEIRQSSLSRVICDNADNITLVPRDAFNIPKVQNPSFVHCSSLPSVDLRHWKDCCRTKECPFEDSSFPTNQHQRSRRSLDDQLLEASAEAEEDATEERIEGLEDLVSSLRKEVKKLHRRLRRVQQDCKAIPLKHCKDSLQNFRHNGEKWNEDSCTGCLCEDGQIRCHSLVCLPARCANPKLKESECCPVC